MLSLCSGSPVCGTDALQVWVWSRAGWLWRSGDRRVGSVADGGEGSSGGGSFYREAGRMILRMERDTEAALVKHWSDDSWRNLQRGNFHLL